MIADSPDRARQDAALTPPFDLLTGLAGDRGIHALFSEESTIESWLKTEVALAEAQADAGDIPREDAAAIKAAAVTANIDRDRLWEESRNVGYPILPLIRQVDEHLPEGNRGSLHLGATTQDIMDTGLALQLAEATDYLIARLTRLCGLLATAAERHVLTVMPGRTHAMQAVPTTWGAKLAVYLSDFAHHLERLRDVRRDVATVSLYGAVGTSAAYGPHAQAIRADVAARLGLASSDVPWHVSRVRLAEWGGACAMLTATASRLAREVIDLSRSEIGEVSERTGHLRGASSTMPQKTNPITSEVLVGNAIVMGGLAAALTRIVEAGHERAAGEWQAEWFLLPQIAAFAASSLTAAVDLVDGLQIKEDAMRANLEVDHGLIMAESYMIALAARVGRERAHDLVYEAAQRARAEDTPLADALQAVLEPHGIPPLDASAPERYVGDPRVTVDAALASWQAARRQQ